MYYTYYMNGLNMKVSDADSFKEKNIIDKVCKYLKMQSPELFSSSVEDEIKNLCSAKLCDVIGIRCAYNPKNDFFNFFSTIMGEAVCIKLHLNINIAPNILRLVRYDGINFVNSTYQLLLSEDVDEAFIDAYNLVDKYKYLIERIKKV